MAIQTEIENKARLWLIEHLPDIDADKFIFDHQGGNRPDGVYVMLNLIRSNQIAPIEDEAFADEAAFNGTDAGPPAFWHLMCGEWEWTFSINVYSKTAIDSLAIVKVAAQMVEAETALDPLLIFDSSEIRRVPELINEIWEERAQMDIAIRGYVNTLGVLVDSIEDVTIEFERLAPASKDALDTLQILKP